MKDSFPFNSLSAKQTVIVGELLRDHPEGQVVNDNGKPVFVSEPGTSAIRISLSETSARSTNGDCTDKPHEVRQR
jgi:hypothetical protein